MTSLVGFVPHRLASHRGRKCQLLAQNAENVINSRSHGYRLVPIQPQIVLMLFGGVHKPKRRRKTFLKFLEANSERAASCRGSTRLRYGSEVNNLIRFKAFLNKWQLIPLLWLQQERRSRQLFPDQSVSNCSLVPRLSRAGLGQPVWVPGQSRAIFRNVVIRISEPWPRRLKSRRDGGSLPFTGVGFQSRPDVPPSVQDITVTQHQASTQGTRSSISFYYISPSFLCFFRSFDEQIA